MSRLDREAHRPGPAFSLVDLALVGQVTIWGMNFVVVKAAVAEFLPLSFTALRFVLAALTLTAVSLSAGLSLRLSRADLGRLALLSLVGNIVYQPLFVIGLAHTTAGNSALILASAPIIVALESHFFKLDRLRPRGWLGVLLSFGGLLAVIAGGPRALSLSPETWLGDGLTLGAAVCWATYTLMARPLVSRLPLLVVTTVSLQISAAVLVLLALPSFGRQDWQAISLTGWGGVLYSGLLAIGLGYALWNWGVQRLGGSRTAVYVNLPPIIATLAGVLLLGERVTALQLIGAAGVLGGIALTRLPSPRGWLARQGLMPPPPADRGRH